jgi:hypothetical protein
VASPCRSLRAILADKGIDNAASLLLVSGKPRQVGTFVGLFGCVSS